MPPLTNRGPSFSEALNAGLDSPFEKPNIVREDEPGYLGLEITSTRRRTAWIKRERRRSWGRGFACGVVACIAIGASVRVGEAWGATPIGVQRSVDSLMRHHVRGLRVDCRARVCAAYSNVEQVRLVLVQDILVERSATYYRVTRAVA